MWVFRGGEAEKPSLVYQYHPNRSGTVASSFLGSYQGAVLTDGYSGYAFLAAMIGVTHLGCWAHVRCKKSGSTDIALALIRKLYAIEKRGKAQNLTESKLLNPRRKEALPVLAKLRAWLEKKSLSGPEKPVGKSGIVYPFPMAKPGWPY